MGTPHKHAELIKAWADGAEIQYKAMDGLSWIDTERPGWCERDTYRIKPSVEIPEGFTAYTKDARFAVDANNIKGYEFLMSDGSKTFFALGHGMPHRQRDIIAYRVVKKAPVVRWQWIVRCDDERPYLTSYFYHSIDDLRKMYPNHTIDGKAEWTRTEFEE